MEKTHANTDQSLRNRRSLTNEEKGALAPWRFLGAGGGRVLRTVIRVQGPGNGPSHAFRAYSYITVRITGACQKIIELLKLSTSYNARYA